MSARRKDVMVPKLSVYHTGLLHDLAASKRGGPGLRRSYFANFPHRISLARDLLWLGKAKWEGKVLVVDPDAAEKGTKP